MRIGDIAPEYGDRIAVAPQAATRTMPQQEAAALAAYPTGKIGQYIAAYDAQSPALGLTLIAVLLFDTVVLGSIPALRRVLS